MEGLWKRGDQGVVEYLRDSLVHVDSKNSRIKFPDGKFIVGCLAFPQCRNVVWLPAPILEATVTTNICNMCTPGPVFKIQFKFRRSEIPPSYDDNYLGCIGGCDGILKELVEFCGSGSRNVTSTPARGRGSFTSFSSAPRTAPQQSTCIHCQQTGHSSNNCHLQTSRSRGARAQRTNPENGESSMNCNTCGMPCVLRTANTENNRGRKFYSCQAQGCSFFVWEDDAVNANSGGGRSNSSRGRGRASSRRGRRGGAVRGGGDGGRSSRGGNANQGRGTFVSATGEPVSGRSCFICGDPSHFANVCPNRGVRN